MRFPKTRGEQVDILSWTGFHALKHVHSVGHRIDGMQLAGAQQAL